MQYKYVIPTSEGDLSIAGNQFRTGFNANAGAIGYDASDVEAVNSAVDDFDAKLAAANLLVDEARNAIAVKNEAEEALISTLRKWAQSVKNNPLATPEMFASMGIVPASSPSSQLFSPTNLGASPNSNGTCRLKWESNGNGSGTTYVIEASVNGGAFTWIGNSTSRRFTDQNAAPGVPKTYRVRAQRSTDVSPPSAGATIYANEEGDSLQIAA